jgi:hypothetical protein
VVNARNIVQAEPFVETIRYAYSQVPDRLFNIHSGPTVYHELRAKEFDRPESFEEPLNLVGGHRYKQQVNKQGEEQALPSKEPTAKTGCPLGPF